MQTMVNSRICHCLLFHEHGRQDFVQPFLIFSGQGSFYGYTHAWTKLHKQVISWISGAYECYYAWPLLEANSTTVHNLTVPSVSSLPLSVMVRSWHACVNLSHLHSRLLHADWLCSSFSMCANLKCIYLFVQIKFRYMTTHKHTHASCNALPLVWSLLGLAPIIQGCTWLYTVLYWYTQVGIGIHEYA